VKTDMPDELNITVVLGTRPEAIKLCPLISAIRAHDRMRARVCVTGQHREMLDQVMTVFGVAADVDLDLMRRDQSLAELTARAVTALAGEFAEHHADLVLVQGDTTTVFCAALAAYYHRISVGHVEAGLRTGDRYAPFPEELNRRLTTHLGDLHFAPTAGARARLLAEGIPNEAIHVTGNTVIDALHFAVARIREQAPRVPGLPHDLQPGESGRRSVLITGHRRENFGAGFESICQAVAALADRHADCAFVYPVHLNPHVREPVFRLLGKCPNVHLIEPLDYLTFVALLDRATLVLTDSGGVQEEAPSLGKPVLVMRATTERPEAVAAGTARLVGTDSRRIVEETSRLLEDAAAYTAMARTVNPYGDGHACARIVERLAQISGQTAPQAMTAS
jgi:UDP-N-acetylglucosamine 2-epimerase (non-hydrolysing)